MHSVVIKRGAYITRLLEILNNAGINEHEHAVFDNSKDREGSDEYKRNRVDSMPRPRFTLVM